eukprot:294422_1
MALSNVHLNKKQHISLVNGYVRNTQQLLSDDIIPQPITDICFRFFFIRRYKIQKIYFNGNATHRLVETEGGTSALLGLCNILLLNNDIRVNQKVSSIEFKDLTWCLKDHLHKLFEITIARNGMEQTEMANQIQNIEDSIKLFPQLDDKLDINIKFDDITQFEYTPGVSVFDIYNIRLLHGLCINPQNIQLYKIMKNKSYKQLIEFLSSDNCSNEKRKVITEFLGNNQLTKYCIERIRQTMHEKELAVLFQNGFFSVVYKFKGQIWKLVTNYDIVYKDSRITWQLLV